jgi:excisionase family DNA binding protein
MNLKAILMADWISVSEAAEITGYHPEHLRRLIRQGKLKAVRKGTMFWLDRCELSSFMEEAQESRIVDQRHGPKKPPTRDNV